MRRLLLVAAAAVLFGVPLYAADPAPAPPSVEDVLRLKIEVLQLQQQLQDKTFEAAQLDMNFADARAQLAQIRLTSNNQTLRSSRESLTKLAESAGFLLEESKEGKLELRKAPPPLETKPLPKPLVEPLRGAPAGTPGR